MPELSCESIKTVYRDWDGSFSMLNLENCEAIHCTWNIHADTVAESAPLRQLFHLFFQSTSCVLLHAASIGDHKGAILLVGAGGAGKSTTSACGISGHFSWLGDDSVIVDINTPQTVHSIYSSMRIAPEARQILEECAALEFKEDCLALDGKWLYFLNESASSPIVLSLPIIAIVAISQSHSPGLRKATSIEVATALSQSTVLSLAYSGMIELQKIRTLLSTVPVFTMDVPRSATEVTSLLRQVFEIAHQ